MLRFCLTYVFYTYARSVGRQILLHEGHIAIFAYKCILNATQQFWNSSKPHRSVSNFYAWDHSEPMNHAWKEVQMKVMGVWRLSGLTRVLIVIKMRSCQYGICHCGDKTILKYFYRHNGISYTGRITYIYWINPYNRQSQRKMFHFNLFSMVSPYRVIDFAHSLLVQIITKSSLHLQ